MIAYTNIKEKETTIFIGNSDSLHIENIISIDPLFLDANNDNYKLNINSPCRDAGIAKYIWKNDVVLNIDKELFKGNAPDIGSFKLDTISSVHTINRNHLLQVINYPNPFNISTILSFELKSSCHTNIIIYNILGIKTDTLFDGILPKGNHLFEWDARYESAGIYFYAIKTNDASYKGKMLLLK